MKLMFISDIHGIKKNLDYVKNRFNELNCEKLIVLGDLLNGPKHNMFYDSKAVKEFLNGFANKIICIKGNCDLISDFSDFNFIVNKDLLNINLDGINFYFNHGDLYNYDCLNNLDNGALIYGHEHIPYIRKKNNILCINPGSISLPRGNFIESYAIYDNQKFTIYDVNDNIIDEYFYKH